MSKLTFHNPRFVDKATDRAFKFNGVDYSQITEWMQKEDYKSIKRLIKVGKKRFAKIVGTWLCYAKPRLSMGEILETRKQIMLKVGYKHDF